MYRFHYDYMQYKYGSKVKLCYMDTTNFGHERQTENDYKDIAKDVKNRFGTSEYSVDDNRPLPIGESKKDIGMIKA